MIDTKEIIQARTEYLYDTLKELGNRFDVTPSYVHQVLKNNNIPTQRMKINRSLKHCVVCGALGNRKVCIGECYTNYYYFYVRCRNCWAEWHVKRSRMQQKKDRGDKNIYCSRDCYFEHKLKN